MRTRTDLFAISVLIGLIALLILANPRKLFAPADIMECGNNLRRIYVGYENFVADNGKPVTEISTNFGGSLEIKNDPAMTYRHFEILSFGILAPASCLCPLDIRARSNCPKMLGNASVSYFISISPNRNDSKWIMSGTRNLFSTHSLVDIRAHGASWDAAKGLHGFDGFFLLGDGSTHKVSSKRAHEMAKAQSSSNFIAIPND